MPYAAAANAVQSEFMTSISSYFLPGNLLAHDMYDGLSLPWDADPSQTAFPKEQFHRFDWDRNYILSDPEGKDFFGGSMEFPIEMYEAGLGTVSAVTRWRELHPELVGTEKDVVKECVAKMKTAVDGKGLRGGAPTVLLLFKRI
jgi:hypothetical protein